MPPFFTIVSAVYNGASSLPFMLESLSVQTCRDFEVVIQEGASVDGTMAVAESFRGGLPALSTSSEPDAGIYDAWNKALLRIRGTWILFLGADDALYAPDTLARVKKALMDGAAEEGKGGGVLFAAGGVVVTASTGVPLRYISGRTEGALKSLREAAIPTPFPGLFMHSSLFLAQRFDANLRIAGDYDFLCRTWKDDSQAVRLPFFVTAMREGGVSASPKYAALCCKETADSAEKHFHTAWTKVRRWHYRRAYLLGILYTILPGQARKIHNLFRRLRGKAALMEREALPLFSPQAVPVFVISFNRLEYLKKLVAWLEENGFRKIIVVDNNSSYPPLLSYLDSLPHHVVRLEENLGHLAVWKCGLFAEILSKEYFILSDPDVLPVEACPDDVVLQFYNRLIEFPDITKCGFSLILDDIPVTYPLRNSVQSVERPYWEKILPDGSGYFAPIDTTFALYRPGVAPEDPKWFEAVRLAPPYAARHLPWYESLDATDEETVFYRESTRTQSTFWTAVDADSLKKENLTLRARVYDLEQQVDMLSQGIGNMMLILLYKVLRNMKKKLMGE